MADHQVHGVVGAYIEPDSATTNRETFRPMSWYAIFFCQGLATFVGFVAWRVVLDDTGWAWANWLRLHEAAWMRLCVEFSFGMAAWCFIHRRFLYSRLVDKLAKGRKV